MAFPSSLFSRFLLPSWLGWALNERVLTTTFSLRQTRCLFYLDEFVRADGSWRLGEFLQVRADMVPVVILLCVLWIGFCLDRQPAMDRDTREESFPSKCLHSGRKK